MSEDLSGIKILVIEDDPFLSSMYMTKFEMDGFIVRCAEDGQVGVAAAAEFLPDITLLDIMMPKMNGFQVLEFLKKDDKLARIPVILLTNLNQRDDVTRGLELGATDYLIKAHFMPSEVVEKVRKLLGGRMQDL